MKTLQILLALVASLTALTQAVVTGPHVIRGSIDSKYFGLFGVPIDQSLANIHNFE